MRGWASGERFLRDAAKVISSTSMLGGHRWALRNLKASPAAPGGPPLVASDDRGDARGFLSRPTAGPDLAVACRDLVRGRHEFAEARPDAQQHRGDQLMCDLVS